MANLQQRAAPILSPFLVGEFRDLTVEESRIIAGWAQMVVTTLESYDPQTAVIPESQRGGLSEASLPSPLWYIGIGGYVGRRYRGSFYHRAIKSPLPRNESKAISKHSYAQITIFALGSVLFHAVSADSAAGFEKLVGDPVEYGFAQDLRTLWPRNITGDDILAFDDEDIVELFDYFGGPLIAY